MKSQNKAVLWGVEQLLENAAKGTDGKDPEKGISISFLAHTEGTSINVVELEQGIDPHSHHEHDEVITILEGAGEASIDGVSREVKPGDVIFCPRGTTHGFNFRVKLFSVYTPYFDSSSPDRFFE